ncbi:YciE/YciF ferroxidase family protein [Flavobacterium orientale]|uniref:YciE/YciF family protein n=1 Tax=Flavobacterium orientale TaxID=1756020 RepID=A0A916Y7T8_9FLAO|nr:ferritin-like domain-containing protein [Flavobacterium orientale]GGD34419.1 YciE/YciF family protein [Flavobacterium orientale]
MKTLQELFEHQLKDLYNAESQLVEALPKVIEHTNDSSLKAAFEEHLQETKEHKKRIEAICDNLDIAPNGETCKAMKGLISEAESFMEEAEDEDLMDVGLIAGGQRIEHYEISGYGTAVRFAKELGLHDTAAILQKTLDEEYKADQKLNKIAESRLNQKAV